MYFLRPIFVKDVPFPPLFLFDPQNLPQFMSFTIFDLKKYFSGNKNGIHIREKKVCYQVVQNVLANILGEIS